MPSCLLHTLQARSASATHQCRAATNSAMQAQQDFARANAIDPGKAPCLCLAHVLSNIVVVKQEGIMSQAIHSVPNEMSDVHRCRICGDARRLCKHTRCTGRCQELQSDGRGEVTVCRPHLSYQAIGRCSLWDESER